MARYCPLFSGSSGNCTYLGTATGGVLIDAGMSAKRIKEALSARGVEMTQIAAIFVTHEHIDHIRGLKVLTKHYGMPVYATRGTMEALLEQEQLSPQSQGRVLGERETAAELELMPFATPHDSRESCGYRVMFPDGRTAVIATDIGCLSPALQEKLCGVDLVHIESNHDVRMLQSGRYPYSIKRRILSEWGHLSNESCAAVLPSLLQTGATRLTLAHLSRENNTPQLAYLTATQALTAAGAENGRDYRLTVATPDATLPMMIF